MDEKRFDHLSRRLAGVHTRRQAVKAMAGALIATVAGTRTTAAQECAAHYSPCTGDEACCSGAVCEYGICMPGCRIDEAFQNAWTSPPGDSCNQCLPEITTTAWTPVNEGMSCWSGDPNAGATFCQTGVCAATGPAACPPPPPCHTDELIDPTTCTYAVAEAGTACGSQAMCHGGFYQPPDSCDGNGFCIGGGSQTVSCAPFVCGQEGCVTTCAGDGDCAEGHTCCDGSCVLLGTIDHCSGCGDACGAPENGVATCDSGVCGFICAGGYGVCNGICAETPAIPDTILGSQIAWITGVINGGVDTLTEEEFYEHFHQVWNFEDVVAYLSLPVFVNSRPNVFGGFVGTPTASSATFYLIGAEYWRSTVNISIQPAEPHRIVGLSSSTFNCPAG